MKSTTVIICDNGKQFSKTSNLRVLFSTSFISIWKEKVEFA